MLADQINVLAVTLRVSHIDLNEIKFKNLYKISSKGI